MACSGRISREVNVASVFSETCKPSCQILLTLSELLKAFRLEEVATLEFIHLFARDHRRPFGTAGCRFPDVPGFCAEITKAHASQGRFEGTSRRDELTPTMATRQELKNRQDLLVRDIRLPCALVQGLHGETCMLRQRGRGLR